jgi:hypothetical protein
MTDPFNATTGNGTIVNFSTNPAWMCRFDVVGESRLVGFPSQFPSVTMIDWTARKPDARFEVLRLHHEHSGAGVKRAATKFAGTGIGAQALIGTGVKRLLLVNKRDRSLAVELPADFAHGSSVTVDESTGNARSAPKEWDGTMLTLAPFAVTAIVQSSALQRIERGGSLGFRP